ncbi:MAG: histidine phosphatase family protein [Aggregatilineales bacterium]
MTKTIIHLVRHGEVHNPEGILYGRLPQYKLSQTGRKQAASARETLKARNLNAIYASPQPRAQETAGIIAEGHPALSVKTSEHIDEVLTPREGELLSELMKTNWDLYTGNQPPYEVQSDVLKRAQHFFATIRDAHHGQEIAAVTHGDIVAFMFLFAKNAPLDKREQGYMLTLGLPEEYPATASISTFTYHTQDVDEVPEYAYLRPY